MVDLNDIIGEVIKKGSDISFKDFISLNIDANKFSIDFSNVDKISSINKSIIDIMKTDNIILFNSEVSRINVIIADIDDKLNKNQLILVKLEEFVIKVNNIEDPFIKDLFFSNKDFTSIIDINIFKNNLGKCIYFFNDDINSLNKKKYYLLEYLDSINVSNIKDKLLEKLKIDLSYYSDFYNENMCNVKLYAQFINFLFSKKL